MINSSNYVKHATATEAPITDAMRERFSNNESIVDLLAALHELKQYAEYIDGYKKLLYYGKERKPVNQEELDYSKIDFNDFQVQKKIRVLHAIIGIVTEAGELVEALEKSLVEQTDFDDVNLLEEAGDIYWYLALLLDATNNNMDECLNRNIAKLAARYPEKFTEYHATNRKLDDERKILEGTPDKCEGCESIGVCHG